MVILISSVLLILFVLAFFSDFWTKRVRQNLLNINTNNFINKLVMLLDNRSYVFQVINRGEEIEYLSKNISVWIGYSSYRGNSLHIIDTEKDRSDKTISFENRVIIMSNFLNYFKKSENNIFVLSKRDKDYLKIKEHFTNHSKKVRIEELE
jgi:hypothetical protein